MASPDTVSRFSDRVANYARYRPSYPPEVGELFVSEMGLTPDSVVADIGSGTGLSAKQFVEVGATVYGVEPNANMRSSAEEFLKGRQNFRSIDGTSEATGLDAGSVDIITAAQAFHWFRPAETRAEFTRILRPGGWIALLWNERQLDTTPFLVEYEKFLLEYANDYAKVRHDNIDAERLREFFGGDPRTATFANTQVFDLEGLLGRVSSSSYMPSASDPRYPLMAEALERLFAKHEQNGRISVFYNTNVFYTQY